MVKEGDVIEVKGLCKSFGRKKVLNNISFNVKHGEVLAILGASGQGKSVLIKTLAGFYSPSNGRIDYDINEGKIAFSMQNNSIYESLTVKQNWKYFGKLLGMTNKDINEISEDLYHELDLKDYKNTLVSDLSGGTRKRVDIGCCLLNNPDVLILDEPFSGLDQDLVKELARYILLLNSHGKTVIITSHRIKLISRICNRVLALEKNKIMELAKDKLWDYYGELI